MPCFIKLKTVFLSSHFVLGAKRDTKIEGIASLCPKEMNRPSRREISNETVNVLEKTGFYKTKKMG